MYIHMCMYISICIYICIYIYIYIHILAERYSALVQTQRAHFLWLRDLVLLRKYIRVSPLSFAERQGTCILLLLILCYDRFNCYSLEIHHIQQLIFLSTNSNSITTPLWIYTTSYQEI